MKTKISSLLIIGLIGLLIVGGIVAFEVFVLTLLGLEYESWQGLALFLVLHALIEYVLVIGLKAIVRGRSKHHPKVHLFFGQLFISFVVVMTLTQWLDTVYMNVYGAAVFAVITASLYMLLEGFEEKE